MSYGDPKKYWWTKWVFFTASLIFGQLANYFNPETPMWGKFAITAISLCISGVILAVNE
jgi:hypothetical protein